MSEFKFPKALGNAWFHRRKELRDYIYHLYKLRGSPGSFVDFYCEQIDQICDQMRQDIADEGRSS